MEIKSCFLIGHRQAPEELFSALQRAVEDHITKDKAMEFIVGGYGEFDRLAAEVLRVAKDNHPQITLSLLLPYHPSERPIKKPEGFDATVYPPGMENVPRRLAIIRANRYVVDHVDFLLAYAWHTGSSTQKLVEYAKKREKRGLLKVSILGRGDL